MMGQPLRRRWAPVAASAIAFAILGALRRRSGAPPLAASLAATSTCKPATTKRYKVSYYKRTSFSTSPSGECAFIKELFDESASAANFTLDASKRSPDDGTWSSGHVCASRCTWTPLAYQIHSVRTAKALSGPLAVDDWVASWVEAHGVLGGATWEGWDAWMHLSLAFWVKDLAKFTQAFDRYGVPYLQRTYANPQDNVTTYAAYVVDERTGGVVEVHSDYSSLARRSLREDQFYGFDYAPFGADECAVASRLHFSTADMTRWLTSTAGDEAQGSARYPMQLVRVSVPATRPEELDAFVATARLDLDVKGGAQRNCGYRAVEVPGAAEYGAANGSLVEIVAVRNAGARPGPRGVAAYETYVKEAHGKLMGEGAGWDAYLDAHVGLAVDDADALDEFAPLLDAADVPYMPHRETDSDGSDASYGSVWTAGFGGLGVELHGRFDASCLTDVPKFEFCHPT